MYKIAVLKGDGIGHEIVDGALTVLEKTAKIFGFDLQLSPGLIGGSAIDECGEPLPEKTLEICRNSNAVLLGAVGGPKWENYPNGKRPEHGLLAIRKALGLYANLRPAIVYQALKDASPLRTDILGDGLDIMVVRELTGGIYFGKRGRDNKNGQETAFDTEEYSVLEIERIAKIGFETAMKRNKKLVSVDKANVLESSRLWRETVIKMSQNYPEVALSHMYVDNAAMQLVRDPQQFDVILTNNIFGDILSDEASQITGSIGMLPSASIGGEIAMYEPIHGSAPDIAGQNSANPIATVLSVAMMLRYSFGEEKAACAIEAAVEMVVTSGKRTADIAKKSDEIIGTFQMASLIADCIKK